MIKWLTYRSDLGVGVLRYILPYKIKFHNCGTWHDRYYTLHHKRFLVDKIFLIKMLKVSTSTFQTLWAILYYISVRAFGSLFYKPKKANQFLTINQ